MRIKEHVMTHIGYPYGDVENFDKRIVQEIK